MNNNAAPPSLNLGMIGNCAYSALVDERGRIVWCCLPRFDGDPVFNALLDPSENGSCWAFELEDFARSEQHYEANTAVLRTRLYDAKGQLDPKAWKQFREACTVHRFWGDADEHGTLIHRPDGKWVFSYEAGDDEDDEPIFRFDRHAFLKGEYVSVTEHDGVTRPFRVAAVETPVSLRKK